MELTGKLAKLAEVARKNRQSSAITFEQAQQRQVDDYNRGIGELTGYDCKICNNKGYIAVLRGGNFCLIECKCMATRRSEARLKRSGINPAYTLQTFEQDEPWQRQFLGSAWKYVWHKAGWFYAGGQVGSGKTHICTGIVRELIKQGHEARYMLWCDDSAAIKASIKYPEDYAALVEPLKTVDVLYIDDFLKTGGGKPTAADFSLAFEILNARYNRAELITIISSEFYIGEILKKDEAVGSRIFERAGEAAQNIKRDPHKNYRLRGTK